MGFYFMLPINLMHTTIMYCTELYMVYFCTVCTKIYHEKHPVLINNNRGRLRQIRACSTYSTVVWTSSVLFSDSTGTYSCSSFSSSTWSCSRSWLLSSMVFRTFAFAVLHILVRNYVCWVAFFINTIIIILVHSSTYLLLLLFRRF